MTSALFGKLRSALQAPQPWTRWEAIWPLITALHKADPTRFEHEHAPYIHAQCRDWPRGARVWSITGPLDARALTCDTIQRPLASLEHTLATEAHLLRHATALTVQTGIWDDDNAMDAAHIEAIVACEALTGLKALALVSVRPNDEALEAIWQTRSGALAQLDALRLIILPTLTLCAEHWEAITGTSPHLPHLTELSVAWWHAPPTPLSMRPALDGLTQPMRVVHLRSAQLTDDDIWPTLARSSETLRELDLQHNQLTFDLIARMLERRWPALERVMLDGQATLLTPDEALQVATSHTFKHTRTTHLAVDETGRALLAASPTVPCEQYPSRAAVSAALRLLGDGGDRARRDAMMRALIRLIEARTPPDTTSGDDALAQGALLAIQTRLLPYLSNNPTADLHEGHHLNTLMHLCEPLAAQAPERLIADIAPQVHLLHDRTTREVYAQLQLLPKDAADARLALIRRMSAPARSHRRAAHLLSSPHLGALEGLELEVSHAAPVEALVHNPALRRLRRLILRLRHSAPDPALDAALTALSKAEHLAHLLHLRVCLGPTPTAALDDLLTGVWSEHLQSLSLESEGPLHARALRVWAEGLPTPQLQRLEVWAEGPGGALTGALLARPLPTLQTLRLRTTPLTGARLDALVAAHPTLDELAFNDQPTTHDALARIARQDHPNLALIEALGTPRLSTIWGWLRAEDSPLTPRVCLAARGIEADLAVLLATPDDRGRCCLDVRVSTTLPDDVIPGTITQDHLKQTLRALGLKLSGRKLEQLDRLREHMRTTRLDRDAIRALSTLDLRETS